MQFNGSDFSFKGGAGAQKSGSSFGKRHGMKLVFAGLILILVMILIGESVFIVGEADQAVVSRFGVIEKLILNDGNDFHQIYADQLEGEITLSDSVQKTYGSGLHFKMPFVDKVETYSGLLYTYVSSSEVVNTAEKKQYYITTYAQWHITDPALFSLKLGSMNAAENQLDNIIHPVIVQAINRMPAADFISNKDALNAALQDGLTAINRDMCVRGIEVVDIQIHRTTLPNANIESTYARMEADRAKEAQALRSEGNEAYSMAVADADLEARQIEADAISKAGAIRGAADAEAAGIYADAYAADPEFYSYWRALQALKSAIDADATLVLDQSNPLFADLLKFIIAE
ncbi:MAG: protease modulator HflC [Clostridiales bacterium]|nr:protease modulator HflC [Clostridiales bacterium]